MEESGDEKGVSRRRFLSFLAASAAGATVAASVPAIGKVASAAVGGTPETESDARPEPSPGPAEWPERRRAILRAHEDVVLHTREE